MAIHGVTSPTLGGHDQDKELRKMTRLYKVSVDYELFGWRKLARMWHDYYHGDQIDSETLQQMRERSQPIITFNLIKAVVGLVAGQEVQGRTDVEFMPVESSDQEFAKLLTGVYRQMGEAGYFDNEMSDASLEGIIGGRGVLEVVWDKDKGKNGELVREYVDWQEMYIDPASKRRDYQDARHIFRVRWLDIDEAIEIYPEAEAKIKKLVRDGDSKLKAHSDDELNEFEGFGRTGKKQRDYGDDFDENAMQFIDPMRARIKLVEAHWKDDDAKNGVRWGIFSDDVWIAKPVDSVYKHRQFPYVFTFCSRDRMRRPYGIVKNLISPQDIINKMVSKSMHILGTKQILAEEGAITNMQNVQENIAKADSIIHGFANGALRNKRVILNDNRTDAGLAFQHFQTGVDMMHRVSGVNPELQGIASNARSGTAISIRQRQANTVLADIYDCISKTKKKVAELTLSIMAQFMKDKQILRYRAPNGAIESLEINTTKDVLVGNEIMTERINDISEIFKFDVVITETVNSATSMEHEFTQLVELLKAVPGAATPATIAQMVRATNLPGKEEIANSILQPPEPPTGPGL